MSVERTTLWAVVSSVAIVIAFAIIVGVRMMSPSHEDEAIGGEWWARRWVSMAGRSSSVELWHGKPDDRALLQKVVHTYRYYGDDCVAYSASVDRSVQYYFACGARAPLALDSGATWDFGDDALQQRGIETSSTAFAPGHQRLLISDLKRQLLSK